MYRNINQMNKNSLLLALLCTSLLVSSNLIAENIDHANMDHAKHMKQMSQMGKIDKPVNPITSTPETLTSSATPLKEAGNAIFGTIQEVIKNLESDPNTNWEKVDIEGLRQHLIDMENFTTGVDVVSQENIEKGAQIVIRAKSEEAHQSLTRALKAHPSMMESETGWTMDVKQNKELFTLIIETNKPEEVVKLRAFGYIGIMAQGDHHQVHHWMMASGSNPHGSQMNH